MPKIVLEHVTKKWGNFYGVKDLNLVIDDREFVTLLGPSGCGKTTTLRMIAGLETPTSGKITIGDHVVFDSEKGINIGAGKRDVGFLFQNYALWPHMTVYQNIMFGLKNVKEELPVYDFKCIDYDKLLLVLEDEEHYFTIMKESVNAEGKFDKKKALIKLENTFIVSEITAKKIMKMKLTEENFAEKRQMIKDALDKRLADLANRGVKLDEQRRYLGDAPVVVDQVVKATADSGALLKALNECVDPQSHKLNVDGFAQAAGVCAAAAKMIAREQIVDEASCLSIHNKYVKKMEKYASIVGIKYKADKALEADALPLTKYRHLSPEEMDQNLRRVSRTLKISEFMPRFPSELSGGQQQRVAIARTLAVSPKVLFMDEPLSNLDAKLRGEMRTELKRLHKDTNSTFVYVTHDQLEAMALATNICLINNGVLQQFDPPLVAYSRPNNLFVADFIGNPTMNFIPAHIESIKGKDVKLNFFGIPATFHCEKEIEAKSDEVVLGVRPEFLPIKKDGKISGKAYSTLPTGMETTVKIDLGGDILSAVVFGSIDYATDEEIRFDIVGDNILLFDNVTKQSLGAGSLEIAGTNNKAKPYKGFKIELVSKDDRSASAEENAADKKAEEASKKK